MSDYPDLDKALESCDYITKLAVTRWVMKHVVEHAIDGGTYRYLIYDRLGFEPDAYGPLCADGLYISNHFDTFQMESIKEIVRSNKIDVLKEALVLCDEPGCYIESSCGWPSKDGYRRTCYEHMEK